MEFPQGTLVEDAFRQKRRRVHERQKEYLAFWIENVAPRSLV
jgi:hypothetical protein